MSDQSTFSRRSFFLLPLAPLALAACKPGQAVMKLSGFTMGTTYTVAVIDPPRYVTQDDLQSAIDDALRLVNAQMSNWDAGSEISRFNASAITQPQKVSPELAEVMAMAEEVHSASRGGFDTTLGPIIELWGFGADATPQNLPGDALIETALAKSGHANTLELGAGAMRKRQADAQVYLAAIGKGYGADYIGRALERLGATNYMVEIGGDLYVSGTNADGRPWQIGIETPDAGNRDIFDVVAVSNVGLASSGDYRNYFEEDGQRFSHLIDPRTGRPVSHRTASATVLTENATLADAWATAFLILGSDEGMALAEELDLAVMFIDRDAGSDALSFETKASRRFQALTA